MIYSKPIYMHITKNKRASPTWQKKPHPPPRSSSLREAMGDSWCHLQLGLLWVTSFPLWECRVSSRMDASTRTGRRRQWHYSIIVKTVIILLKVFVNRKCSEWPQNDLSSYLSKVPCIHRILTHEAPISVSFTLRPAVFDIKDVRKSVMHRMFP